MTMTDIGNISGECKAVRCNDCISIFDYNLYDGEFMIDSSFHNRTRNAKVYLLPEMQSENETYRLLSDVSLSDLTFIQVPAGCTINFQGHRFRNCVLLSNSTRVMNLPTTVPLCKTVKGLYKLEVVDESTDFEIIGKIYNEQGQQITLNSQLIERTTPLLFNYAPQVSTNKQYDGPLNNFARRARRLGLYDCLIMANVTNEQYNLYNQQASDSQITACGYDPKDISPLTVAELGKMKLGRDDSVLDKFKYGTVNTFYHASLTGGWAKQGYVNTPKDLVAEMYLNGLSVRGIKFHQSPDYWLGSVQDYCNFVLQYVMELKGAITEFNNPAPNDPSSPKHKRNKIDEFNEVYIANEMHVWTAEHCNAVPLLVNLADILRSLGFEPQISFAGMADMFGCDHRFYQTQDLSQHLYAWPNLNFYPKLSYQTVRMTDESTGRDPDVDNYINNFVDNELLGENLIQRFKAIDTFWQGSQRFDNNRLVALSEVGVRPCQNSLRFTSNRNPAEIGEFNECVMPIYWKAIEKLAREVPFKYMVVFFHDWIYNNSSGYEMDPEQNGDANIVVSRRENSYIEERMYEIFRRFGSAPNNQNIQ